MSCAEIPGHGHYEAKALKQPIVASHRFKNFTSVWAMYATVARFLVRKTPARHLTVDLHKIRGTEKNLYRGKNNLVKKTNFFAFSDGAFFLKIFSAFFQNFVFFVFF